MDTLDNPGAATPNGIDYRTRPPVDDQTTRQPDPFMGPVDERPTAGWTNLMSNDPQTRGLDPDFETLDPKDWDDMRRLGHRIMDDAIDYLQTARERPVWQPVPPDVRERLELPAPADPSSPESVYEAFRRDVLAYPMNTSHPRFWAWYMGSGTVMGALAELLAATLNPNLGGANHVAPLVEKQVIGWIRDMIGFPAESSGLLTSGASMANLTALTVARNSNCGYDVRRLGVAAAPGPLTAYASSEIHSCNQKAIETLGLGSDALRRVPVDAGYRLDLQALARQVQADRDEGRVPFCVIATAGTINTGAIDDLQAVGDFCAREGLWFHVDGAIGAVAVLAEDLRPLLAGIERADSVALDLHKWMHIPFEAGCVIVRDAAAHRDAFALVPEYLQREDEGRGLASGSLWFSDYGLQLSRQFRALKIWMSVKEHGLERFGRMMSRNADQAQYLGRLIEAEPRLELMAPVGLDIVCFRFNPGGRDTAALDRLNQDILAELQEDGIAAPSYTTLRGAWCLRVAIANHRSTYKDFDLLVAEVLRIGSRLSA
jgi:aromatic-L-amino-acid decarboxylase